MTWFLVVKLWLLGAPGPEVYIPVQDRAACMAAGGKVYVDFAQAKDGTPLFRATHRCVLMKGA